MEVESIWMPMYYRL